MEKDIFNKSYELENQFLLRLPKVSLNVKFTSINVVMSNSRCLRTPSDALFVNYIYSLLQEQAEKLKEILLAGNLKDRLSIEMQGQ